ncbi:MAG: hypothetical protein JRI59_06820 [Deltaproteobacteria bacterium]|nr:hypothetical protein [Deltaproteobacteria bacterium]
MEELRDAIHANNLSWGNWGECDKWERFWEFLFSTEKGQDWLYAEEPPAWVPVMDEAE